ncbi:T9SS type A sorting domain-containing protein [Bacteroidota bacterium]
MYLIKKFTLLVLFLYVSLAEAQTVEEISNRLTDFSAKISKDQVNLQWKVVNPVDVKSIILKMKKAGVGDFQFLSEINVSNYDRKEVRDSLNYYYYSYRNKPKENGVYYYKIIVMDNNYKEINSNNIKVGISEIEEFTLYQNNPNPFNPSTVISYDLFTPTNVTLKIYTLNGKQVAVLVDEFQNPGTFRINFDINDFKDLSSGIYFYKMQTNYSSDIKKMIFTK